MEQELHNELYFDSEEDDDADGGVGDKDQYKHQAPIANMFTCTDKLNLPELTCPHPTSHP